MLTILLGYIFLVNGQETSINQLDKTMKRPVLGLDIMRKLIQKDILVTFWMVNLLVFLIIML